MLAQRWISIAWPAFLAASVMEMVIFAFIDPLDVHFMGEPLTWSRNATYTLAFFVFWAMASFSSVMTSMLGRTARELNGGVVSD